eukprot:TRINITY_DN1587_c0_g1_i1.p1 TRINITY_DN1587_c0_g1~~TRINITY_DN1587_c0_g1_i1.p1  ORF type:complete len:714 (-),score=188.28 TRINITY_DN1587_c0_g1_i1:59-2200(-)
MTKSSSLLLSLLGLLATLSRPVSASHEACATDDETGLLQTGHDALRSASPQQNKELKRHAASKASIKLDQPKDLRDVPGEDDVQATAKSKGAGSTATDSKQDKVVEVLIPGMKGASSTVLKILNPQKIYAQKAVNESDGSIVEVENQDNMVLKATSVEDGQRTVYDGGEKRVSQASTKISIAASEKGKIRNLDELLAKAKQALQEAQQDMLALEDATQATLVAKKKIRNATLAKNQAEKRLDQLASNPGIAETTVAGVEEAAQLAKQTLKLDSEAREDRKNVRAADADRRAVASRMARRVALVAEHCACGYGEAVESTDGTHVNFKDLAAEFRQEPARVAGLRAKLAAKGERDALAHTVVKVRTKERVKLSNGEEAPAGSVVVIERPAAVSTAVDEGSGETVMTIDDPENIFLGDDWNESQGTVHNVSKVSPISIPGSALNLLETSIVEGPNLTDLQQNLDRGHTDINQAQLLLKEFSDAKQKTESLAKELAEAIEVRNSLSKELQQYANKTADIGKNIQTDVLSNSNSNSSSGKFGTEFKLGGGQGNKTISWQVLDKKTASGVVNESVTVQEAAEKVASLATQVGEASARSNTLEQSWGQAVSQQQALAKKIETLLRGAVLSSSLSLDDLEKSGAQVDVAAISRALGDCPPASQAIVGLREFTEDEEERQILKEEDDSKDQARMNWWAISLTGIIVLIILMILAILWRPFAA